MKLRLLRVRESTGTKVTSPADIEAMFKEEALADRECMWVLHINTAGEVIEKELCFMGTLDQSIVHPREIFKKAILNSAVSIVTVHNHPSGNLEPSEDDKKVWDRLVKAGELLGIDVRDNLIVSRFGYYSWKAHEPI